MKDELNLHTEVSELCQLSERLIYLTRKTFRQFYDKEEIEVDNIKDFLHNANVCVRNIEKIQKMYEKKPVIAFEEEL